MNPKQRTTKITFHKDEFPVNKQIVFPANATITKTTHVTKAWDKDAEMVIVEWFEEDR